MANDSNGEHVARPLALFVLELGANGGTLAPTSVDDLLTWIQAEVLAWQWLSQVKSQSLVNLKGAAEWARQPLAQADTAIRTVMAYASKSADAAIQAPLQQIQNFLQDAFIRRGLPHTSSPQGKRLADLVSDQTVAVGYVYGVVASEHKQLFTQGDANAWRGFLMGLQDRYGLITDKDARLASEKEALSDLRARAEHAYTQRGLAADELHRRYEILESDIDKTDELQKQEFTQLLEQVQAAHAEALGVHETAMNDLKRAFKDGMALRGPVEYWSNKADMHQTKSTNLMCWSFGSIAILTVVLGGIAWWIAHDLKTGAVPDTWKVSVLALVGVLGIWVVRLVIRMWLSHAHLATDADERVTMVQTYLALLEDGKMTKDEDRALVLTPLFRPAADGLVKDEGLPHPMLEMLTRSNK
jgi:Family of unknown function (DUF6161)